MPSPRASINTLAKLLDSLTEPVYVLDEERRIVYCNQACREWTCCAAEDLLGQECRYHSRPETTGAAAVAAALCPPLEVFQGQKASATIVLPAGDAPAAAAERAERAERHVEFVPLARGPAQVAGVMAFVQQATTNAAGDKTAPGASAAELHAHIQRFRRWFAPRYHVDRLLGDSPAMRRVRAQVCAASAGAASVLVLGPKGGGRQHVARAIHYAAGPAASGSLVPLACTLLDVDLLGETVRALRRPKTPAPQGAATLLLDDADELPEAAQVELARLLAPADLPFRIIATAREPLATREGFRHDLACRLSTIVIDLPPLAARPGDMPLLAQAFLEQANAQGEKQVSGLTTAALERLAAYDWPGDLDELEAMVRESHARAERTVVGPRDLPSRLELAADAAAYARKPEETIVLDEFMAAIEQELIERAMKRAKRNKAKAAQLLGMTRPRLYRRLVQLGLVPEQEELELTEENGTMAGG
ncbi:MAG TPA: helix-turn-helix domain-containing protein [Pirellulales bacterium]|nr:helix-turn-helix domain-containing protein [Pirellulales bacterium]